jgi:hypothetical protein
MAYFDGPEDVDKYLSGVFRLADTHPDVGPKLRAAGITLQLVYSDPESVTTVRLQEPMEVFSGPCDAVPDVTLTLPADIADRFWRGDYNLAVGLAKRQVMSKGPVNKILKLVPLTKPMFPLYREMIAEKDGSGTAA